jgi:hypothetical protein
MIALRLFLALPASLAIAATPAAADHGGPLASTPMSPLATALIAGALAFVAVLLLAVIWRLFTGSRGDGE